MNNGIQYLCCFLDRMIFGHIYEEIFSFIFFRKSVDESEITIYNSKSRQDDVATK